jgi:putative oxidoreductase
VATISERKTNAVRRFDGVDDRIRKALDTVGITALRVSVGLVFVWFGLLKIFDVSPVSDLVAQTVYWFDPDVVVPALGVLEVAVGTLLLLGKWLRTALALFAAQMLGTFLVFIVLPEVAFRDGNPLLLTVEGEFVVKNLVLLAAGMVVGARVRPVRQPTSDSAS